MHEHRQVLGQPRARDHRRRLVELAPVEQCARPEGDRVGHRGGGALGDEGLVEIGKGRLEVSRERQRAAAEAENCGCAHGVAPLAGDGERTVVGRDCLLVEARAEERERRAVEAERPLGCERAGGEGPPRRGDRSFAVAGLPAQVEGLVGEQQVAPEAAVERLHVERLHQCCCCRVVVGVPPCRGRDLGLEPFVEVRMRRGVELVVRPGVDRNRLFEAVRIEELVAELERDLCPTNGVVEQREARGQVIGGAVGVEPTLGQPELDHDLAALGARCPLEGARQVARRDVGCSLRERAGRGGTQGRHGELVVPAAREQEVGGGLLGKRTGAGQDLRGASMRIALRSRVERLVDRRPNDGVEELDRIVVHQQIGVHKHARGAGRLHGVEARQGADIPELCAVAEDRGRLDQRPCLFGQASEPKGHGAAYDLRAEVEEHVGMVCARVNPLAGDGIDERQGEQRVAARGRLDGRAEVDVGFFVGKAAAHERRDRGGRQRARADLGRGRIGEELRQQLRVPTLLRRPGRDRHVQRKAFEPAREVAEPAQRR